MKLNYHIPFIAKCIKVIFNRNSLWLTRFLVMGKTLFIRCDFIHFLYGIFLYAEFRRRFKTIEYSNQSRLRSNQNPRKIIQTTRTRIKSKETHPSTCKVSEKMPKSPKKCLKCQKKYQKSPQNAPKMPPKCHKCSILYVNDVLF